MSLICSQIAFLKYKLVKGLETMKYLEKFENAYSYPLRDHLRTALKDLNKFNEVKDVQTFQEIGSFLKVHDFIY